VASLWKAEGKVGAPKTSFHVRHPHKKFPNYVALMSSNIDAEPLSYEEATCVYIWHDAMVKEYKSIMKNDVWEIVLRLEGQSMVD
jgi:hypothetical protein